MISKESTKQEFISWLTKQIEIESEEEIIFINQNRKTAYNQWTGIEDGGYHAHRIRLAKKEAMDNIVEPMIETIRKKIDTMIKNEDIIKEDTIYWNNAWVMDYNNKYREYQQNIKNIYLQDRDKLKIEPEKVAQIFIEENRMSWFNYEERKINEDKDPSVQIFKVKQQLNEFIIETIIDYVNNYSFEKKNEEKIVAPLKNKDKTIKKTISKPK